jgi:predicted nucleic acid-binding protein
VIVVVADTSPLHYLVLIEHVGVLPVLFQTITIPSVVQDELMHPEAPQSVRHWMMRPPGWIDIRSVVAWGSDAALNELDDGERAAIELAASLKADLLLIDERKGAAVARNKGFAVTGTLGVLELAADRGLLDLADALSRLKGTSFRCRQEVIEALLARHKKST